MTVSETNEPGKRKKPIQAFERLNAKATRQFSMVAIDKLFIPVEDYQRDESDGRLAQNIAMHFDDVAFGALTVIKRRNGDLIVVDGGTRLSGARLRKDILEVACVVYSGLSSVEEADTFSRINMDRRKLRTSQQQKAELFSGKKLAIAVDEALESLKNSRVFFDSLALLRNVMKSNLSETKAVIGLMADTATDKHLTARVLKGLVYLEVKLREINKSLTSKPNRRKLIHNFGLLDAAVNGAIPERSSGNKEVCARAIARQLKIPVFKGRS